MPQESVTAEQIISGHRQLIARAHAHSLKVYGATIAPFKGARFGLWTEQIEAERQAVNHLIRASREYDCVIDVDAAVQDPADPCSHPAYDAGDHIHLNDVGATAVAEAVPLSRFSLTCDANAMQKTPTQVVLRPVGGHLPIRDTAHEVRTGLADPVQLPLLKLSALRDRDPWMLTVAADEPVQRHRHVQDNLPA